MIQTALRTILLENVILTVRGKLTTWAYKVASERKPQPTTLYTVHVAVSD